MNILIIAPAWIGDMVMSHSLYQTLKQQYPDSAIDVLAPAWCHPLLARMPEIRHQVMFEVWRRREKGEPGDDWFSVCKDWELNLLLL